MRRFVFAATLVALLAASGCATRTAARDGDSRGSELRSGMVVASEGGLDAGRLWFIWEGAKARIYQPRALAAADLAKLGLRIGSPAPKRLTLGDEADPDVFFAVYPPDGPDAALHLAEAGELHRVTIVDGGSEVAELPELDPALVTRARTGRADSAG